MKLQSLRINHFGHFADFELPFEDASFVVLHGHNEAGKSTLLEFVRKVLFGFEERERFSFGDGGEIGGRLLFDLSDGRRVDLSRRKGRKNTVQVQIDGVDSGLDEVGFKRLIGDPDANLFKSIFAIGLDELRNADESLKHESLRSALYAGGMGAGLNLQELLGDLESQALALFKSGGSKPAINAVSREIADLMKQLRGHIVKPDDYHDRERRWREEQTCADHLVQRLRELRAEQARIDGVLKALPLWNERRMWLAERAVIVLPPNISSDGRRNFENVVRDLRRLQSECLDLERELGQTRHRLSELRVDEDVLAEQAEISDCRELEGPFREAHAELPELHRKLKAGTGEVEAELHQLRPGWTLGNLKSFSLSAAAKHALGALKSKRDEQRGQAATLQAKLNAAIEQRQQADDELRELGGEHDVSRLVLLVEQSNDYSAEAKSLVKERELRLKLQNSINAQRLKLVPPLTDDIATPELLTVPPKELAQKFEVDLREANSRLMTLNANCSSKGAALRQLQDQLRRLDMQHGTVPTRDEVAASRHQRDEQWQRIRDQFIEGDAVQSPVEPQDFEASIATADRLADEIYENAEAVSQRERLHLDIEHASGELTVLQTELAQQQAMIERLHESWRSHWMTAGIEPLPPEAMSRWVDEHAKYVALMHDAAAKDVEIELLASRCSKFEAALQVAITESGLNAKLASAFDVKSALTFAKQTVKSVETANERRKSALGARKKQQQTVERLEAEQRDLQASEVQWQADWQVMLSQLELPSDWSIELASSVVDRLTVTQAKLKQLADLQARIELLQARIREFEPRVAALAQRLSEPFDGDRPEVTARKLHVRHAEAMDAKKDRVQLVEAELLQASKLETKTAERTRLEGERADLWRRAGLIQDGHVDRELPNDGGTDERELTEKFLKLATQAERAEELDNKLAELGRQLDLLRGSEPNAEFESRLSSADETQLRARLSEIKVQLSETERAEQATRESAGGLRREFESLDGTSHAAMLQESVAQNQAKLVSEIHRYVPLVFARRLLQDAIASFEREHQPELVRDISKLFASLTRGEYIEIERPTSDRDLIYVRRHDGAERSPEQLSTGTREQLYLAIRLGYIRHYCRGAEPLPIVMDDVLVNFDIERAKATMETLREFSRDVQVLFFTCHDYFVDVIREVVPNATEVRLPSRTSRR